MRQTVRAVLPGSDLLAALRGSTAAAPSSSSSSSWRLRPCTSWATTEEAPPFPAPPALRFTDPELLAGLDHDGGIGGFRLQHLQPGDDDDADEGVTKRPGGDGGHHPARWVTAGRSKGQPGADVTRGVLRLWLRNDHPSLPFHAEVRPQLLLRVCV